jgi:glycosyltransferase involved in cell wall biosynthesis
MVVEDNAHSLAGHYPILFAQVARALASRGVTVQVLTQRGWALSESEPDAPFDVVEFGPASRGIMRLSTLAQIITRDPLHRTRDFLRTIAVMSAARGRARRTGCSRIVVTSRTMNTLLASVITGRYSWVMYSFDPPLSAVERPNDDSVRGSFARLLGRAFLGMSKRRASRPTSGGAFAIVVNTGTSLERWRRTAPWFASTLIPFGASDATLRASRPGGIDRQQPERVALSFGAPHEHKDLETVFEAFEHLGEWQLVVAGGGAADAYRRWAQQPLDDNVRLIDGYVDNVTRAELYASSTLVVLSFRTSYEQDSATLADAIAAGKPVVCSRPSPAGSVVEELCLGRTFQAGNKNELIEAVRSAPSAIQPVNLEEAREILSIDRSVDAIMRLLPGSA